MGLFSYLGVLSPAAMQITKLFSGAKSVGTDVYGNTYFTASPRKGYKRNRRWVIYNGKAEASMVPPEWHGWMHHQTDDIPNSDERSFRRQWQKSPQANLTGTAQAYRPPGHILKEGKRPTTTGDYEAWTPPE